MLNQLSRRGHGSALYQFLLLHPHRRQHLFPVTYDPRFPNDSYFLQTHAQDKQIAWFGEATYSFTDQFKTTVGRALL